MKNLTLSLLDGVYSVHRLHSDAPIPAGLAPAKFVSITRSADELSIVCLEELPIESQKTEGGWSCIQVLGPLDFGLTGILAGLAKELAEAGISIFAVSTYDTDYLLVKQKKIWRAKQVLIEAGYQFV